ncbi:PadR family transcriptional regulator [Actinoplanes italicus]|uniref:DNA-binding PadR family transcriptional regulator n=1 Tax=Actinoplanes italicus TaxID=113567 RepID=A0A2T0KGN4_9ACTN|nr:PadR family transcriptional regulator [Actinoplanes italicus]PRX22599.1 DNA-binding PadR family transcriptional regulator [Actinoplanes italicus]GIE28119.1 PadR family transcriptional regulator [Actinoplanes italicus]
MTIATAFLALLESGPRHGYDLKQAYDQHFGVDRPLHYAQVYTTLAKLLRNGLVTVDGVEGDGGPDRKRYTVTEAGVTDVQRWLDEPEKPQQYLQSGLYAKVIGALLTGRSAAAVLDAQRDEHLDAMRELTRRKMDGDLADRLICDHALFHLDADLRWLEHTADHLDELAEQVRG